MQRALDHQLAFAIGVDRALRRGLADRNLVGNAVGRAGRGEDDALDVGRQHDFEQPQAVDYVVAEIELGLLDRFLDIGEGGEMHHRSDGVALQRGGKLVAVREITLDQRPPAHRLAMAAH